MTKVSVLKVTMMVSEALVRMKAMVTLDQAPFTRFPSLNHALTGWVTRSKTMVFGRSPTKFRMRLSSRLS